MMHKIDPAEHALVLAQRDVANARCDRALAALREVLGVLSSIGGFMKPQDQQKLRDARALLAEDR